MTGTIRIMITLKVNNDLEEDFDSAEVFMNYKQYANSSIEDEGSDSYDFPVNFPATRVYGEIRHDPGGLIGNNITIGISDEQGNSTDNDRTDRGEREEGGETVKWVEIKGEFVLQCEMENWKAHVERNDRAGGSEDYSLYLEMDYDPVSGL